MRQTKIQTEKITSYILNAIDLSDRTNEKLSNDHKLIRLAEVFNREYGNRANLRYYGSMQKTFENWLMGLPSCINIDFENYEILKLGRAWGFLPEMTSAEAMRSDNRKLFNSINRKEDRFIQTWWSRIFVNYRKLLDGALSRMDPKAHVVKERFDRLV